MEEFKSKISDKVYTPIPRISRTVPFGYTADRTDPDILLPVVLELDTLEEAKKALKTHTLRDVAEWMEAVTGRKISAWGLSKRIKNERRRASKARAFESWSERAEKIAKKAEEIKAKYPGAHQSSGEG